MSTSRRTAVSYNRFSDPKQSKGDSERRQEDDYRDFCQRHNLTPGKEVFTDRGRSGYHDEHRTKGRLGQLIATAKDGRFDPGTVIVIEAWDRLGRLRPDRQTELVAELLRTGVSIGICRLNEIFCEDDFGSHKWTTLSVFVQLAYQESKQKAERGAAVWVQRRKRAKEQGGVRGRQPALLAGARRWPDPARPRTSRGRAPDLRVGDVGAGHDAPGDQTQPREGGAVRAPGTQSRYSGRWTRAYLLLILNDRRVLGEISLRKGDDADATVPNYFPAVVTPEEFALARASQDTRRQRSLGGPSSRQSKHTNVFQGLLINARDGLNFRMHNYGSTAKPALFLRDAGSLEGHPAPAYYSLPYLDFEKAVLGALVEVRAADVFTDPSAVQSSADALRAQLALVRSDLAGLKGQLAARFSKTISELVYAKEAEELDLVNRLQDELARSARPVERAWGDVPGLVEAIRTAADPNEARIKVRAALRATIESMTALVVNRPPLTSSARCGASSSAARTGTTSPRTRPATPRRSARPKPGWRIVSGRPAHRPSICAPPKGMRDAIAVLTGAPWMNC